MLEQIKAVIKLQIVEGEQRRSSGKGFELLGGGGGEESLVKKSEKTVLRRLALPISVVINEVGDLRPRTEEECLQKDPTCDQNEWEE